MPTWTEELPNGCTKVTTRRHLLAKRISNINCPDGITTTTSTGIFSGNQVKVISSDGTVLHAQTTRKFGLGSNGNVPAPRSASSEPSVSDAELEKRIADAKKNSEQQSTSQPSAETRRLADEAARQEAEITALKAAVNNVVVQSQTAFTPASGAPAGVANPVASSPAKESKNKVFALLLMLLAAAALFYPILQQKMKG